MEKWDGTAWRIVESPSVGEGDNVLVDVAASHADDVWAVGYRDGGTLVVHWDGERWEAFPSPGGAGTLQGVSAGAGGGGGGGRAWLRPAERGAAGARIAGSAQGSTRRVGR